MTKQEFDLKYKSSNDVKIAVHCDTEEKAKAFLSLAKSFGYRWVSGDDLDLRANWGINKKLTYYVLDESYNTVTYGSLNSIKADRYKIVPFEFEEETFKIEPFELDEPNGYAIEDTPSPIKETTKKNNMKYKVGDKVRVRSDLKNKNYYGGIFFSGGMETARGNVFTIGSVLNIEENMYKLSDFVRPDYYWSAEMLEPVTEEEFKIGDVVYTQQGRKGKIVDILLVIEYEETGFRTYKEKNELTKTKPLKKITKEQLKEMGYELE